MAQKERQKVTEDQVTGLKYFKRLTPLLKRLHEVGCERDKAGNRGLHFDQLSGLYLLFIFNPVLSSLRGLQQASELKKVQRKLGCKRASLGSLSEAAHVFDADALEQVVTELGDQLEPLVQDERLEQVPHLIEIVDGTLLKALPRVVEAMWYSKRGKARYHDWRLHTHFSVTRAIPTQVAVTNGSNRGEANEKAVLRETMEPDRWDIEVFFRFFKHTLGCRHLLGQSSNGIRIQTYYAINRLHADRVIHGA